MQPDNLLYGADYTSEMTRGNKLVEHLDLTTFKLNPCKAAARHNHKHCIYFHSAKDRRRNIERIAYEPELCLELGETGRCSRGDFCQRAHNKVEQAYHPSKYRFKFCNHFPDSLGECGYGRYCSYAHSELEVKGELIHNYVKDIDFFLFVYKTRFCPFTRVHDRSRCVYAHNWQDFRRDPIKHHYKAIPCRNWDNAERVSDYETGCRQAMDCIYSHGRVR